MFKKRVLPIGVCLLVLGALAVSIRPAKACPPPPTCPPGQVQLHAPTWVDAHCPDGYNPWGMGCMNKVWPYDVKPLIPGEWVGLVCAEPTKVPTTVPTEIPTTVPTEIPTVTPDPCANDACVTPTVTPDPCANGACITPTVTPDPCANDACVTPTVTPDPCANDACVTPEATKTTVPQPPYIPPAGAGGKSVNSGPSPFQIGFDAVLGVLFVGAIVLILRTARKQPEQ